MQIVLSDEVNTMRVIDGGMLLINVLDEHDFTAGHIPGSINIPISDERFVQHVMSLTDNPDHRIIVYCKDYNCMASLKAVLQLEKAGYTNVWDLDGGIEAWTQNNYPLTIGNVVASL